MSIGSKIAEMFQAGGDLVMATVKSKPVQGTIKKGARGLHKVVDKAAGVANDTLKVGQTTVENLSDANVRKSIKKRITEGTGKVVRNTITDEDAYKAIKLGRSENSPILKANNMKLLKQNRKETPIVAANKFLIGDEIHKRVKTGIDSTAHILGGDSILTLKQPLITGGGDSLLPFGMKATGAGVAVAGAAMMASGTPEAVQQWNKNRMGTNYDNRPVTSAPSIPAYANNGGATGDLVFALNNLRHGGMM